MLGNLADQLGQHVPRMYRVALRIVGDPDQAQDVVQDACVKALGRGDSFDGRASVATWFHAITTNCARDHLRSRVRARKRSSGVDLETVDMLAVMETTPAMDAEQRELYRLVSRTVAALPEDCRSAFILTQLDGYSYDEAAAIEGQPRGTMASRVFRAKNILFEQMNAHTDERAEA